MKASITATAAETVISKVCTIIPMDAGCREAWRFHALQLKMTKIIFLILGKKRTKNAGHSIAPKTTSANAVSASM